MTNEDLEKDAAHFLSQFPEVIPVEHALLTLLYRVARRKRDDCVEELRKNRPQGQVIPSWTIDAEVEMEFHLEAQPKELP